MLGLLGGWLILIGLVLVWSRQQPPQPAARVYVTNYGDGLHIYRQWRDGSGVFRLTPSDPPNRLFRSLTWSPDGRWLAYTDDDIYLLPSNGHQLKRIVEGYHDWISWSPDGKSIVFQTFDGQNWDIFRLDLESSQPPVPLNNSSAADSSPAWSPDGEWIAFVSSRTGSWDIYRMRPDGGDLQNLTNSVEWEMSPIWSRDSQWISFEIMQSRYARIRSDGSEWDQILLDDLDGVDSTLAPVIDMDWHPVGVMLVGMACLIVVLLPKISPLTN
jgi:Tol biopolymer transport system component